MTSERSTDSIIDLLYGELSEEDEELVRTELGESPELRAELDSYEDLLGRVREAMPPEDVPTGVHASIMEAARAAAEKPVEERIARRGADNGEAKTGIWRRLAGGQGSQFALVAAVLIAGLFVVKFADQGSHADLAPASDLSAAREPAPSMAVAEKVPEAGLEEVPTGGEVAAQGKAEPAELAEPLATGTDQEQIPEAKPTPEPEPVADGLSETLKDELAAERDQPVRKRRASARPEAPRRTEAKPRARPQKKSDRPVETQKAAPAPTAVEGRAQNNRAYDKNTANDDDSAPLFAGGEQADEYGAPAAMEDSLDEANSRQEAYRPAPNSIDAVTEAFRRNDPRGTIVAADDFLASGGGSDTQKADALFMKAQSLKNLGRYSEADRLLESIQKNYPGYSTQSVKQAHEEVRRAMEKRPARKKSKAAPRAAEEEFEFDSTPTAE